MKDNNKVRENRVRRMAERQGYALSKSRRRDQLAPDYGGYMLVDAHGNCAGFGAHPYVFSASLDDVENFLAQESRIELVRRQACLAVEAISKCSFEEWIPDKSDFGRKFEVRSALANGATYLHHELAEDVWATFRQAFTSLRAKPPSRKADECCKSLLMALDRSDQ